MSYRLFLILLLLNFLSFSQENKFDLIELLDLVKSKEKFELKMYSVGNDFSEKKKEYSHLECKYLNEKVVEWFSASDIPTNDKSKELKFKQLIPPTLEILGEYDINMRIESGELGNWVDGRKNSDSIFCNDFQSENNDTIGGFCGSDTLFMFKCLNFEENGHHSPYKYRHKKIEKIEKIKKNEISFGKGLKKSGEIITAQIWYSFKNKVISDYNSEKIIRTENYLLVEFFEKSYHKKLMDELIEKCEYIETNNFGSAIFKYRSQNYKNKCDIKLMKFDYNSYAIEFNWAF